MAESRATLWHYTDAGGLGGIIQSHSLRLGDARFLNDRTERLYGRDVVMEVLEAEQQRQDDDGLLAITARFLRRGSRNPLHLCSFSEDPRSISQWQRYGSDGYGYCIGFSKAALSFPTQPYLRLRRVVYNPKRQRLLVVRRIAMLKESFKLARQTNDEEIPGDILLRTSAVVAAIVLDGLAVELKNPSFRDEREWRLIHDRVTSNGTPDEEGEIKFRARGNFLKPYIEIHVPRTAKKRSPITAVICGPRLDGDLAVASAEYFLTRAGIAANVSWSELSKVWR